MNRHDIMRYFELVNEKLKTEGHRGEIVLAGGAVMLLVLKSREMTKDVDAYFGVPSEHVRNAALAVAREEGLPDDWLNDGVKGFFYGTPPQDQLASFSNLNVYHVSPRYMIAMKALAGRPEDIEDLKALIRFTGLNDVDQVLRVVQEYVPPHLLRPQVQYNIEAIFEDWGNPGV